MLALHMFHVRPIPPPFLSRTAQKVVT